VKQVKEDWILLDRTYVN